MRRVVRTVALHAVLAAGAALTLLPLLWMVAASFMPAGEASAVPPRLVPSAAPSSTTGRSSYGSI